jgi:aspartate/glutamate racemase
MNQSNQDECIKDFHCVDFFRKIKDEISAELNSMTPDERHIYNEQVNAEARDFCRQMEREKAKSILPENAKKYLIV